jgi:hypothetical protein
MPYKAHAARRHKIPRARYKLANWPEYDRALQHRGSLTVWVTPEALAAWHPPRTGRAALDHRREQVGLEVVRDRLARRRAGAAVAEEVGRDAPAVLDERGGALPLRAGAAAAVRQQQRRPRAPDLAVHRHAAEVEGLHRVLLRGCRGAGVQRARRRTASA